MKKLFLLSLLLLLPVVVLGADSQSVYFNAGDYFTGGNGTTFTGGIGEGDSTYTLALLFYSASIPNATFIAGDDFTNRYNGVMGIYSKNPYIVANPASSNLYLGNDVSAYTMNDSDWYVMVAVFDGANRRIYIYNKNHEGAFNKTSSDTSNIASYHTGRVMGERYDGTYPFSGYIYNYTEWDFSLNSSEVYNFIECGESTTCPEVVSNHSLESVVEIESVGSEFINSPSYVNVQNGSFIINDSVSAYSSWAFNIRSNSAQTVDCRVLLDGLELDSAISRSFGVSEEGSLFTVSSVTPLSVGSHWVALQCRRSSGPINVFNVEGLVHLLGSDGVNLSFVNDSFSSSLGASSSLLSSYSFTTGNISNGSLDRVLVLDAKLNNSYVSSSSMDFYANVSGEVFPLVSRGGVAGSSGSLALFGIVSGFSANQTLNLSFYGNSSSGDGSVSATFVLKEFVLHSEEWNSTSLNLGSSFAPSSSFENVSTLRVENLEHLSSDFVVKAVVGAYSSLFSTDAVFRFILNNSASSFNVTRDFTTVGRKGVVILQEAFNDVPFGVYDVTLQVLNNGGAGNLIIDSGAFEVYVTGDVDFNSSSFEVTAFDSWNNNSILSFNVTDGLGTVFVSNASGVALVSPNDALVSFSVSTNGYFSEVVSNHPYNETYISYLNESLISFSAFEVFTNNSISSVTFEVTNGTITKNTTSNLGLALGNYNVTSYKTGFYPVTVSFSVASLDVKTILLEGLYTSNVTIVPRAIISNASLSGLNISLSYGLLSQSFFNVSNASFSLVNGTQYNLSIDGVTVALYEDTFSPSGIGSSTTYVYLYSYNSLWVYAFDQVNNSVIEVFSVTLQSESNQYYNNSNNNFTQFNNLLSGVYSVIVNASGYVTNEYTITIDDNAHQTLNAYLANLSSIVYFTVKSEAEASLLEGALISQKKFIGGVLTTISSALTDIVGETSFAFEPDIIYTFVVSKSGYESKTFTLAPAGSADYLVFLLSSTTINPSVYVDDVLTFVYDSNVKNVADAQIRVLFSSGGSLTDYFVNMSLNGSYNYVSGSSATGSVLTAILNLSSATIGDTILLTYGYKSSVNADYVIYSKIYTINTWSDVSGSFADGRAYFAKYGFLERALLGTILAMFFAGVFIAGASASSIDMLLAGSLGGIIGFGLATYFGLFTWQVFATVGFILGMIVVSNLRGKS